MSKERWDLNISTLHKRFQKINLIGSSGEWIICKGEIFDTLLETKVLIEQWRWEYNTFRPHISLGYLSLALESMKLCHQIPLRTNWRHKENTTFAGVMKNWVWLGVGVVCVRGAACVTGTGL